MKIHYIFLSILAVSSISLIGIVSLVINQKKLEDILLFLVSFSAGALLGDCFIHILPEIVSNIGFNIITALLILCGILVFLVLEKFIYWRHCHVPTSEGHPHPIVFMNLVGDGLHNFIDGMAIAASYLVSINLGITTTIAVIFHEIPQEMGDFGVLVYGGFSKLKALTYNLICSLTAFLGAISVIWAGDINQNFSFSLMAFSAGSFIYIAGVDLLPELKKETELMKSIIQLIGFISGIGIMLLLYFING
ncbi:ZIP family metal transporter [Candidatus Poribacteria bacterium]|nr:ZIP family metal transporter [Candidatus Poribacteria bacterium]